MTQRQQNMWKLAILGGPLLILVVAGIAITGFLALNLVTNGVRSGQISTVVLGTLLGAMWLLMFIKTITGFRRRT